MEIAALKDFWERFRWPLVGGLVGLVLIGGGVLGVLLSLGSQDKIEIISSSETPSEKSSLLVDIEGAVEKPGVYELPFGSRVEDLLIVAGGLSPEADREWVRKTLNRAQKLTDGVKIYIPRAGEEAARIISGPSSKSSGSSLGSEAKLVNINTASQGELEALWGIGPVTAQKIIENRPYQSVDELLSRKILKSNVYERIVDSLSVY